MPPKDWIAWLSVFRERFIADRGWTEKEAKRCIRDGWSVVRDGQFHELLDGEQRPADAVPVFRMLTCGGWKTPIEIVDRLTNLIGKAMTSDRSPRDIVIGLLGQIEHAEGLGESDEVLRQRHTAAAWAQRLLAVCEHKDFSEVAGTDLFWSTIICALQTGRRLAILELCRDPQVFSDLIKAQAFQSGRAPDEVTQRLKASYHALCRERKGRHKPEAVARAAGGRWRNGEDCWEFILSDGEAQLISKDGLYGRLQDIRKSCAV